MRTIRRTVTIGVLALVVGCGSVTNNTDGGGSDAGPIPDSGGGPDGPVLAACAGPSVAIGDLFECQRDALCGFFTACSTTFLDKAECLDNFEEVFTSTQGFIDRQTAAINANAISYDGALAFQCFNAINGATCTLDDLAIEMACQGFVFGPLDNNDACIIDEQCGIGGDCDRTCDQSQCCMGTCSNAVGAGASCATNPCLPGLHCAGPARICTPGSDGSVCASDFECDSAFFCDDVTMRCVADRLEGAACDDAFECAGDLRCVNNSCQRSSVVGDACDGFCNGPLWCDDSVPAAATCQPLTPLGGDCSVSNRCDSFTLVCENVGGGGGATCVTKPGLGQDCISNSCAPGLWCDTTGINAVCAARQGNGSGCTRDTDCQSLTCSGGSCATFGICF